MNFPILLHNVFFAGALLLLLKILEKLCSHFADSPFKVVQRFLLLSN